MRLSFESGGSTLWFSFVLLFLMFMCLLAWEPVREPPISFIYIVSVHRMASVFFSLAGGFWRLVGFSEVHESERESMSRRIMACSW